MTCQDVPQSLKETEVVQGLLGVRKGVGQAVTLHGSTPYWQGRRCHPSQYRGAVRVRRKEANKEDVGRGLRTD